MNMTANADLRGLVDGLREAIKDWGDNLPNVAMVDLLGHADRIDAALSVAQGQGWREQIGPDDHVAVITNTPYGRGVWFNSEAACAEFCKWPFSSEPPTPAAPAQPDGVSK